MEIDDTAKAGARELGDAINSAIGSSREVIDAIQNLRDMGYEPNLTLKLQIALSRSDEAELSLTSEDLKILDRMKIRFD